MKIARKYQIFDTDVEVMDKDLERLGIHLRGWNWLNEVFLLGVNEPDLRRLVVIELIHKRRLPIIRRLLGRLAKAERAKYLQRIERIR